MQVHRPYGALIKTSDWRGGREFFAQLWFLFIGLFLSVCLVLEYCVLGVLAIVWQNGLEILHIVDEQARKPISFDQAWILIMKDFQ